MFGINKLMEMVETNEKLLIDIKSKLSILSDSNLEIGDNVLNLYNKLNELDVKFKALTPTIPKKEKKK